MQGKTAAAVESEQKALHLADDAGKGAMKKTLASDQDGKLRVVTE